MFATMSRWIVYPLVWLVLMVLPLLLDAFRLSAGPASETNRFSIPEFAADYSARRSADGLAIDVTERITAFFPSRSVNRGIERRLDTRYGSTDLRLSGFEVTEPDGDRIPFRTRTESDGDLVLRIGRATTYVYGRVDYVIRYTIGRAMVQASDRQEIYLDVNGTGWQQRFDRVSATLRVAPDLAGALLGDAACYRGPAGSSAPCSITRDGATFRTESVALAPRETMTVAVGFAPGTVTETLPALTGGFGWPGIVSMPVVALVALGIGLLVRRRRLRSLLLRDDAPIQYTAPDVAPLLAADFLGLPERGAAAQLTQLVLDGHATLAADAAPTGTAPQPRDRLSRRETVSVRDLRVKLLDPERIDASVSDICAALFGAGRSIPLGSVRRSDVAEASELRWQLLRASGLRGASWFGRLLFWGGFGWLVLVGWLQVLLGLDGLVWPFLGLGLLAVLLLIAAAHYYPTLGRLTESGRRLRDHLAGLHRFVTMAEADRIAWMQNAVDAPRVTGPDDGSLVELYEPLLPYAIIFGAENTWRQALGDRYDLGASGRRGTVEESSVSWALSLADGDSPWTTTHHDPVARSYWDSRPRWGEGWVAGAGRALAEGFDGWATSRDDDRGGSWGSGGSSWSSGSSGSSWSSSGSSGGGSSGGGAGGGGGGGW